MTLSTLAKFRVLVKSVKILKNWYLYPLIYLHLIKREHVILKTRSGIKIKLRVHSTDFMAFTNIWLLEEYNKPDFRIRDNDIIIDIGSHVGFFALYAYQFCKNGKIYCFEPVTENFKILQENLELNNIQNVSIKKCAISDKNDIVTIYLNEDDSGHSMYDTSSESIQVPSISLKDIIDSNNLDKCDLIKIDCEGGEYEIINSLPDSYFCKINKMCIEYHFADEKPILIKKLAQKLLSLSFEINTKSVSDGLGYLYALRK